MELTEKTYHARGKRGIAFLAKYQGRTVLVKEPNPAASIVTTRHEAMILELVNAHGIGPKYLGLAQGALVQEFIEGVPVLKWGEQAGVRALRRMLGELFDQCRTLDSLGVSKMEMTRPYKHVLIRRGHPVQIDFDRAKKTLRPKNVTQLCQWVLSGEMGILLEKKGISVNRSQLLEYAKAYKDKPSPATYERIRALIHER